MLRNKKSIHKRFEQDSIEFRIYSFEKIINRRVYRLLHRVEDKVPK